MKIAILGSSPHVAKAPFNDPDWEIWVANMFTLPRIDRYFQFHTDQDLAPNTGLMDWMKARDKPIYMRASRADIPASIEYPLHVMMAKYGTWFFTSTVAYMLALALETEGVEEIGLWGIDMQHREEYRAQRPGCHFFLQLAKMRGIKLTVPPECELLIEHDLYMFGRNDRMYARTIARKTELQRRYDQIAAAKNDLIMQRCMVKGKLELTTSEEQARAILEDLDRKEPGIDRDLLILGGALELIHHIELNWFCGGLDEH